MHDQPGRRHKGPYLDYRKPRRLGGQGGWVIFFYDANGRRREKRTGILGDDRREEAEKVFAKFLTAKHTPKFGEGRPDQVLITTVLAYYLDGHGDNVARRDTLARSVVMLGKFCTPRKSVVNDITPQWCDEYVKWRIAQGDARGSNKWKSKSPTPRVLKDSTPRNDLSTLQAAIQYCYKERKLAVPVPVVKPAKADGRPRWLSRPEAARLLLGALGWDQHGRRHRRRINRYLARFIVTGLYSGTRKNRILRMQWVENLQGGWIDIERGIMHRRAQTEIETKKKAPDVALGDRLWAHMQRWRKLTARFVIEHNGSPITRDIFGGFEGACELAGLACKPGDPNRVTPHVLRHTCATWALAEGKSTHDVGKYVGMTAQQVDRTYGHVNDAMLRATANAIGGRTGRAKLQSVGRTVGQKK